ncbi:phospholipase D family protein [Paracoccus xiamenensis]|uniref:phospholipase D family protein n=1 Tax=Paracoccus xiamenensis TaxID=2714901 RepID=UPI001408DBCC|nr:phospholipase D family protein [Paracoccus xiamenensis]NHF73575.1 phospholipase D family protein [Paracoccus xiamenensis]
MMRWLRMVLQILFILALLWVAGRMLFPVPSTEGRPVETAMPFDPATRLGPRAAEAQAAHPGKSGVLPLPIGLGALHSRIALARNAERSIDVMYYIWHDDVSGLLLMEALRDAAARGVRVRLLLDDNGIAGLDQSLAAMHARPNFDVRLFNPSTIRTPKMAGYALYPLRMNRRMHNKAFIVDGAAAIVGGRNIGNEYFAVGDEPSYLDLDVLGVGKVVTDTAAIFDEYWNSAPVLGLEQVISGDGDMAAFDAALEQAKASDAGQAYLASVRTVIDDLTAGRTPQLEWTDVQVVADDPVKGSGDVRRDQLMINRLGNIVGPVASKMDLISAYFVPSKAGTRYFGEMAKSGAQVRILTNAWEATDVPMVHAGYTKYRRELLEDGADLYELKPTGERPKGEQELGPIGSSGASLHAKTFVVDDSRVFIGSFNFDPRSALLNCEMGFLIDSPTIAAGSTRMFDESLIPRSFKPELKGRDMVWLDPQPDGSTVEIDHEPGLGMGSRIMVYVLNVLPIEWLL